MRQIQNIAKSLGKFMGVKEIKEFIFSDEDGAENLTDEEIESIILMTKVDLISEKAQLSPHHLSIKLSISIERIEELSNNDSFATEKELNKLNRFIEENQMYL